MSSGDTVVAAPRTVAAHIASLIGQWDNPSVEQAIFGAANPFQIARRVDAFCRTHLGAPIAGSLFYCSSVGAVLGLELADGRRVVVKVHQPDVPVTFLAAMHVVTARLASKGFPCPSPILGPTSLGKGHATVEQYAAMGEYRNPHERAVRRQMAAHLAWLLRVTAEMMDTPGIDHFNRSVSPDALWPKPHSALFDFEATAAGAGWIDGIARRAKRQLASASGRPALGHADWSAKHFRFEGDEVRAIYDWDSLRLDLEPVHVGRAAHAFTAVYDTPWDGKVPHAPSWEEVVAFVADYEAARGTPFTPAERRTVGASCAYSLAYSSRCSHALDPRPGRTTGFPPGNWRDSLDRFGEHLLDL
jgi:hypothetical protein